MLKISNLRKQHEKGHHWPVEKKIEAVSIYLAVGNMRIVAGATGVDYQLLRLWKTQPWWKEYEYEVKNARRSDVNTKMSKLIDKSLEVVSDRLENGEMILNNKTGELMRKPVNMKDATKVTVDLLTRQAALDKMQIEESGLQQKESIQDTLKALAEEFAKFNGTKKSSEVIDAEDVSFKEPTELPDEEEEVLDNPLIPGDPKETW
jgi:hypothetical protein